MERPDKRQRTEGGEDGVLTYLALHYSPHEGEEDGIEWASSYEDTDVMGGGVATKADHAALAQAVKAVAESGGFAVAFRFTRPLMDWFRDALPGDAYDHWKDVKKFHMDSFSLFLLVDEECYEYWTLTQLHSKIFVPYGSSVESDNEFATLVGEAYRWFATHHPEHIEPLIFWGPIEDVLITPLDMFGMVDNGKRESRAKWISNGGKWDDPSASQSERKTPEDVKYVVVDVETHDWKAGEQPSRKANIGRIVEIAWVACNEAGEEVEAKQYLLKPHGGYERIAEKAVKYHGITNTLVRDRGSDAALVLKEFTGLLQKIPPNEGFVIAHNMRFEDAVLYTSLDEEGRKIWGAVPKCDTMEKAQLALLPRHHFNKYYGRKWGLKLTELHKIVCPEHRGSHHTALADARMAWDIFAYYRDAIRSLNETAFLKWNLSP